VGETFGSSPACRAAESGAKLELQWQQRKAPLPPTDQLKLFTEMVNVQELKLLDLETLLDFWHISFISANYAALTAADEARLRGESIMENFFAWWTSEQRDVVAVEKGFQIHYAGTSRQGTAHHRRPFRPHPSAQPRASASSTTKSTGPRSQQETDEDLQLSVYALAARQIWNEPVAGLTLLFLMTTASLSGKTKRD